jgi:addiction module HigA family antidote
MARLAIHPGEHVQEELEALHMSAQDFAARLAVPVDDFEELLRGERDMTADMAMRLAHFFGTSAEFWLKLQNLYDLRVTEQDHGDAIKALPTMKELLAA